MTDRKGPSPVSALCIWVAYLAAIALESLLLCHTWWQVAALVVIGVVVFLIIMVPAGVLNIKRYASVHILLIAILVLSALVYKALYKTIFG